MSATSPFHEDPYCKLYLEPELRLVTYRRTAVRYPDIETGRRSFALLGTLAFGGADRLISDVREAPGNNSPEFEAIFDQLGRKVLFGRFAKRAVLVRTVAGKLQVERLSRQASPPESFRVFQDEAEARKWVLG